MPKRQSVNPLYHLQMLETPKDQYRFDSILMYHAGDSAMMVIGHTGDPSKGVAGVQDIFGNGSRDIIKIVYSISLIIPNESSHPVYDLGNCKLRRSVFEHEFVFSSGVSISNGGSNSMGMQLTCAKGKLLKFIHIGDIFPECSEDIGYASQFIC